MKLAEFNQAEPELAQQTIAHCVAIPEWQQLLVAARPFTTLTALQQKAEQLMQRWQLPELQQALNAHPRIGQAPQGKSREAVLSGREQSAMQQADDEQQRAMRAGNQAYEARFGRLFLIRATGRSAAQMLAELQRRLHNSDESELQETLVQLREITLLRLKESIQ